MTPTPHASSFPIYALCAVAFTYGGVGLLFAAALWWERYERRLNARHSRIVTFPACEATVTRIYGDETA